MILKGYQECLKSSGPQEKDPILVVSRTLKEDSDVRIALQALRRSPGYTALRDKKIWALSGAELKEHLQVADCSDGFMISRMNHRFSHVIQSSLHFSNV